ncbi:MAG: hypothetical protein ABSF26_23670 [Thermoguttaceae bacterium]|jgi:hypothetical protein
MSDPSQTSPFGPKEQFRLYELLWAKLNQEGDGIWSRFNILVGLHLALFAAFGFFFATVKPHALSRAFAVGISLLGAAASLWSLLVFKGLWTWHRHWKSLLVELEKHFPTGSGWVKPHTDLPEGLPFWRGAPGSSQPFFVVLLFVWGVLLGVAIAYGG